MKELNRITLKDMFANKRRTLVTIIGITLSSMLLFLVALGFSVYRNQGIRYVIDQSGSQHAIIGNVDMKKKNLIIDNVKDYFYYSFVENIEYLENTFNVYTISDNYDADISLIGQLPNNENEIVISKSKANWLKLKIGDYLENYQIVGLYDSNRYFNFANDVALTKTVDSGKGIFYVYFNDLNDMTAQVRQIISKFEAKSLFEEPTYSINNDLLSYHFIMDEGQALKVATMILMLMLIMFVLGFVTLFVIYNSFAISVNERKKTYGMYKSMGATPKQILQSVFFESFVISLISIPLGFVLSIGIGQVLINVVNKMLIGILTIKLSLSFYLIFYLFALFFIFTSIFIATLMPAKRASETSPIDTIRETKVYVKTKSKKRLIKKIFGIEGVISSKNSTSNYRKYNVTVFSIIIGCVLFLTTAMFVNIATMNYDDFREDENISINIFKSNHKDIKYLFSNILESKAVDASLAYYNTYNYKVDIDSKYCLEKCYIYKNLSIYFVENDLYDQIKEKIGDGPYLVDIGNITDEVIDIKLNDEDGNIFKELSVKVVQDSIEVDSNGIKGSFYYGLILPLEENAQFDIGTLIIKSEDFITLDKDITKAHDEIQDINFNYNNQPLLSYQEYQKVMMGQLLVNVGFIIIILITVTSIVNTVTTNLQSRKHEFAVLRSVGLSPKQFEKMIFFESIMLSTKALVFGLLISLCVIFGFIYIASINSETYEFIKYIFPFKEIIVVIIGVYIIVYLSFYLSTRKLKKSNVMEDILSNNY